MFEIINDIFNLFQPSDPNAVIECTSNNTCVTVHSIVATLLVFFTLLTGFAYTTLLERRFIAMIQSRIGPNRTGPMGLLQPVADGIKLIFKEEVIPQNADKPVYWIAPLLKVVPALIVLAAVPLGPKLVVPWFDGNWYRVSQGLIDPNVGVLWVLAVTSISVYGVTLAGWASANKYAMLGALRSSANMISYELSMGLCFIVPVMLAGSLRFGDILADQQGIFNWYVWRNPLAALLLWIALMAEVNRAPFDMPEAEQELVAGHMTEYSGMKFALFFMAEYINMIGISVVFSSLFLGGYDDGFGIVEGLPLLGVPVLASKVIFFLVLMVWIRGTIFRPRYDRLMAFGWKVMLPLSMLAVAWTAVVVVITEEGGGDVARGISTALLFVVMGGLFYLINRELTPRVTESPLVTEVIPSNRGLGFVVLNIVGSVLAVPFALVGLALKPLQAMRNQSGDQ
jgi:NADH-quinone oxidoreductase subunit H